MGGRMGFVLRHLALWAPAGACGVAAGVWAILAGLPPLAVAGGCALGVALPAGVLRGVMLLYFARLSLRTDVQLANKVLASNDPEVIAGAQFLVECVHAKVIVIPVGRVTRAVEERVARMSDVERGLFEGCLAELRAQHFPLA